VNFRFQISDFRFSRDATHRRRFFSCAAPDSFAFFSLRRCVASQLLSVRSRLFPSLRRASDKNLLARSASKWVSYTLACASCLYSGKFVRLKTRHAPLATRNAVTLIELLITITIIATLSAAFLGASRSAMETSRAARTKTTIAKIHGLLMERWASYATRRVDIHPDILASIAFSFSGRDIGLARYDVQLLATRQLLQMEMPDRWRDITLVDIPDSNALAITPLGPTVLASRPSLSSSYLRRFATLKTSDGTVIRQHQGAECLYMTIMLGTGDGEARTLFSQQDIGDTDGDGAPEFLDGWGRPISVLRWPSGFILQSDLMTGDADADHDPIDFFRRDQNTSFGPLNTAYLTPPGGVNVQGRLSLLMSLRDANSAFRLIPLIYSSGSDGISDLNTVPGGSQGLDPYTMVSIGLPSDFDNDGDNWIDNIHNHLQDGR